MAYRCEGTGTAYRRTLMKIPTKPGLHAVIMREALMDFKPVDAQ